LLWVTQLPKVDSAKNGFDRHNNPLDLNVFSVEAIDEI